MFTMALTCIIPLIIRSPFYAALCYPELLSLKNNIETASFLKVLNVATKRI